MRADRLITLKGFLQAVVSQHKLQKERPFCFILGAGASCQSGIATGKEMALEWLKEIHAREDFTSSPLEQWATAENLGIKDFDFQNLGTFYPQMYDRRFKDNRQAGYAFLEDKMQGKEPSFGYSVLAYLLSETPHKVVITTNFDNLVADALSQHSTTFPIVVSDDALAGYAQVDLRRPLIAKVHGGLGFAPKSEPGELECLSKDWQEALQRIFERYTPIVIGYDGNDGSLMGVLKELPPEKIKGLYWCFHSPGSDHIAKLATVPDRVKALVNDKQGQLVPIPGFDELMLLLRDQLGKVIGMPNLLDLMKKRSRDREKSYDEQERALNEKLSSAPQQAVPSASNEAQAAKPSAEVSQMLEHAVGDLARDRKEKPWWQWDAEARAAKSLDEKDHLYTLGLEALPTCAPLLGNYAYFLQYERKDMATAEEFYKRAIDADPKHAVILCNYAIFLQSERKDMSKAEEFYLRAIDADPKHANNLGNYALFLKNERRDITKAEEFYKRAIDADPKHANNLGNYALFLKNDRKDMTKAEEFYLRAIDADPKHANALCGYALFLKNERKDMTKAEEFYLRAIDADPKHAVTLGNYAHFLQYERKDMAKAEEFYKRAIDVDSKHANNLGNYALFLMMKDITKAEEFYKHAIAADPKHANTLGNYANFLKNERKDMAKAEEFYKRAIDANPRDANTLGNYAQLCFIQRRFDEAQKWLAAAEALQPPNPSLQVELAFYRLAHDPAAWPGKLPEMARLLGQGARSPDWPLDENIAVAEAAGHPNAALLRAIAGVISHDDSLTGLTAFPEWPATS